MFARVDQSVNGGAWAGRAEDFVVSNERPTIPKVLPLVKVYYAKPGNGTGGSLHIVLEDGNVETSHVQWCLERAQEQGDEDGVALARLLLRMSRTQRNKLYAMNGREF